VAAASTPANTPRIALRPLAWTCAAFAGGVLLHADHVPFWAAATALALAVWRVATARTASWYPPVALRAVLALALVAIVLARFHTLNGLAAGTTLLMLMAGLKLLETRTARDEFVMVGAALFLLLAACLDREDLARAPLYALEAWVCCAALALVAAPECSPPTALKLAGKALLLALPVAVLLFLFFPRLAGAFWAIPRGDEALTGLSDRMTPEGISELVASYDPAFRVKFIGAVPPPEERYWRGPVLHDFDGHTWRRIPGALRLRQPLEYLSTPYRYRVALEPSRRHWWIALDTPASSPDAHVLLSYDYELLATEPVSEPLSYDALSYTRTRAREPLGPGEERQDTRLPATGNPRTHALAESLHAQAGSDADFVQAVLNYLRTGGFSYTTTPEQLGPNAIDDFLFNTREGFCGHFASAFVVLMRAARVPARVVTGYLGGEWNPVGGYFLVRQSDAHAWAEVWLAGRGWARVDPTAVVAPERLRRGIIDLLPDALSVRQRLLHESPTLTALLQRWDAANAWWTSHVVRYDYSSQLDLLLRLGVRSPDVRYLGWAFTLALCGWLALIAWQLGKNPRPARPDALARAYAQLCRKLARVVPPRASHQGPLSFASTVMAYRPDLEPDVGRLLHRYAQLRYGTPAPGPRAADIEAFRRSVRRLSLRRRERPPLSRT
jgi:protein-glutamine gamma-glutamyltransferase